MNKETSWWQKPQQFLFSRYGIGSLLGLVLAAGFFGLGYWAGQRSMAQQMRTLGIRGGNFGYAGRPFGQAPFPGQINANALPANATPEMKEFLQNRQTLMEKMAELRQQNPNGAPNANTFAQFQQQNAALLQRQHQLMGIISQQQGQNGAGGPIMGVPGQTSVPANASPQLKAFLTDRNQLMQDQTAFLSQHQNDDPQVRQAAMQQWRQQNAARFQQLQQEALALGKATSPPPSTPTPPTHN